MNRTKCVICQETIPTDRGETHNEKFYCETCLELNTPIDDEEENDDNEYDNYYQDTEVKITPQ